MDEIMFGKYAAPVILTILLALFYGVVPNFPKRFRALFAVGLGIGLGMLAIHYNGLSFTASTIIDFALAGLMMGASAVGLYEAQRAATKPRE